MCSCTVAFHRRALKLIKKRLPITSWLPSYEFKKIGGDLIAGFTCGVLVIPHALALASLAGLPPQYGLYSALPGTLVYCLLGTSKDLNIGPTALTSMLTAQYGATGNPIFASLLSFLIGCIVLTVGIFKLGFVTEFISTPVLSGFTSAIAITIAVGQLRYLLGLGASPHKFYQRLWHAITELKNTNLWDAGLGAFSLIMLFALQWMSKVKIKPNGMGKLTKFQGIAKTILWTLGIARSALVAFTATVGSYIVHQKYNQSFTTAGELPPGLPSFQSPFETLHLPGNQTVTTLDAIKQVGAGTAVLSLIIFLETVAISKALSKSNGYQVDSSQEALALGMSNIIGSFFQAYPVAGSFSRSAVNSMTKAVSPLAGVISSLIVVLALTLMTPVFKFVPIASLAAIIIASVVRMIEIKLPRKLWHVNKVELVPLAVAFLGSFYELEVGILLGTFSALCFILYRAMKPRLHSWLDSDAGILYFEVKGGIWFAGINAVTAEIRKTLASHAKVEKVVIDCEHLFESDFSSANGLRNIVMEIKARNIEVEIINLNEEYVRDLLMRAGLKKALESKGTASESSDEMPAMPLLRYQTDV